MDLDELYEKIYNNYSYCKHCKKKTKDIPTNGTHNTICEECNKPKDEPIIKGCR